MYLGLTAFITALKQRSNKYTDLIKMLSGIKRLPHISQYEEDLLGYSTADSNKILLEIN